MDNNHFFDEIDQKLKWWKTKFFLKSFNFYNKKIIIKNAKFWLLVLLCKCITLWWVLKTGRHDKETYSDCWTKIYMVKSYQQVYNKLQWMVIWDVVVRLGLPMQCIFLCAGNRTKIAAFKAPASLNSGVEAFQGFWRKTNS